MARPLRIEYEGAVYHVTVRGNRRSDIFKTDQDRERLLKSLAESLKRFEVRLYLFCLMSNHVHLVVATPRGNLSRFMHCWQTAYTVYFNRRHQQSGHLTQGRFGACLVEQDEYLLKLSRYVHLNPVFTKAQRSNPHNERIAFLRKYPWSSYRSYIGKCRPLPYVDHNPVLSMMNRIKRMQASSYRGFVESGIENIDAPFIEKKQRSRLCIGSDAFHEQIDALYEELLDGYGSVEDVSYRRSSRLCSVDVVMAAVCQVFDVSHETLTARQRDSIVRPVAAKALCDYCGLTQRQVAKVLHLNSGSTVSKQLSRLSDILENDKTLRKSLDKLDQMISVAHH